MAGAGGRRRVVVRLAGKVSRVRVKGSSPGKVRASRLVVSSRVRARVVSSRLVIRRDRVGRVKDKAKDRGRVKDKDKDKVKDKDNDKVKDKDKDKVRVKVNRLAAAVVGIRRVVVADRMVVAVGWAGGMAGMVR